MRFGAFLTFRVIVARTAPFRRIGNNDFLRFCNQQFVIFLEYKTSQTQTVFCPLKQMCLFDAHHIQFRFVRLVTHPVLRASKLDGA